MKDVHEQKALMIMTDGGAAFGHDILEFVADPVEVSGRVTRRGDILLLESGAVKISRI